MAGHGIGHFVSFQDVLESAVSLEPGQIFSQQLVTFTEEAIGIRLGQDGYAFAEVRGIPPREQVAELGASPAG